MAVFDGNARASCALLTGILRDYGIITQEDAVKIGKIIMGDDSDLINAVEMMNESGWGKEGYFKGVKQ